jgi:DNA-3-methyladenine glycosylase II
MIYRLIGPTEHEALDDILYEAIFIPDGALPQRTYGGQGRLYPRSHSKGEREHMKTSFCFKTSSQEVQHLCAADERLAGIIHAYGDLKYSLHDDPYLFFVETIIGQMLSNKVADIITGRMVDLCDGAVTVETVAALDRDAIRGIGLSNLKTDYIVGFTQHVQDNPSFLSGLQSLDEQEILSRLTALRGIGNWTAKMYLIFSLNKLDILPFEDGAFLQVYKWLYRTEDTSPKSVAKQCSPWKPYSSIAARYLYRALDTGMVIT